MIKTAYVSKVGRAYKIRLIADEGKILVNGNVRTFCTDTDSTDGWTEEDYVEESPEDTL